MNQIDRVLPRRGPLVALFLSVSWLGGCRTSADRELALLRERIATVEQERDQLRRDWEAAQNENSAAAVIGQLRTSNDALERGKAALDARLDSLNHDLGRRDAELTAARQQIDSESKRVAATEKELLVCRESLRAATQSNGAGSEVEETTIDGNITGLIKNGYIFKTVSGGIYELTDYKYLYEYVYRPEVTVIPHGDSFKLLIEGIAEPLICKQLQPPRGRADSRQAPRQTDAAVVESTLANRFDGFQLGNVYKLLNGQIYEQTEAYIWVYVAVMPKVTILKDGVMYKMKVDGIDHSVQVRRLN